MRYAGFWRRFGAMLLDLVVLLPLIGFTVWGGEQSRLFYVYYAIPGLLIGLWFHIYLVKRYGGTPGKLLLNIKIAKVNGANVRYKEAILRYSVTFLLGIPATVFMVVSSLQISDAEYFSMGFLERTQYFIERDPGWYNWSTIALNVWVYSEFFVMLTNKKRRAIHDFMAGTVVIHRQPNSAQHQLKFTEST